MFARPARLFIVYSYRDQALCEDLTMHLVPLRRQGLVAQWFERRVDKNDPQTAVRPELAESDLILLLVSPGLMSTPYYEGAELAQALAQHRAGSSRVVVLLVKPVNLDSGPWQGLRILPSDSRPVSLWPDADAAWLDITQGIRQILTSTTPKGAGADSAAPRSSGEFPGSAASAAAADGTRGASVALTRPVVRRLIDDVVRLDSDLEALCLDYFPSVKMRFSSGMERTAKVNILLLYAEPEEIVKALQQTDPDATARSLKRQRG